MPKLPTFSVYVIFQIVAYGLDFGTFYLLAKVLDLNLVCSNVLGKLVAGAFAFAAHRYVTFFSEVREGIVFQALKYIAALVANSVVGSLLLVLINQFVPSISVSKLISDVIAVLLSYILSKFVIFRPAR